MYFKDFPTCFPINAADGGDGSGKGEGSGDDNDGLNAA